MQGNGVVLCKRSGKGEQYRGCCPMNGRIGSNGIVGERWAYKWKSGVHIAG